VNIQTVDAHMFTNTYTHTHVHLCVTSLSGVGRNASYGSRDGMKSSSSKAG